jgi:hypothetical protein
MFLGMLRIQVSIHQHSVFPIPDAHSTPGEGSQEVAHSVQHMFGYTDGDPFPENVGHVVILTQGKREV